MTILDLLADEVPQHGGQPRGVGALILRDMAEIEEARQHGYSWAQVSKAAKAKWVKSGEWDAKKSFSLAVLYNKMKRTAKAKAK